MNRGCKLAFDSGFVSPCGNDISFSTASDTIALTIASDTTSGISPLEATLSINGTFSVTSSVLTVTGPSQPEYLSSSATEYKVKMTDTGIYYFTATVIGHDSVQHQDSVAVTVMSQSELDALLKNVWSEMKAAMTAGDAQTAAGYFTEWTRERYSGIFTALGSGLSQVAQAMQDIQMIYARDGVAKYRIRRTEATGEITYYIYFVLDESGLWKIQQF